MAVAKIKGTVQKVGTEEGNFDVESGKPASMLVVFDRAHNVGGAQSFCAYVPTKLQGKVKDGESVKLRAARDVNNMAFVLQLV